MPKHIDRKGLKEDAFVDSILGLVNWIKSHRVECLRFSVLSIVILVCAVGWIKHTKGKKLTVSNNLFQIMSLYQAPNVEAHERALEICQNTIAEYADDKSIDGIMFYEGNLLYRLDRFEESMNVFQLFLEKYPQHEFYGIIESNLAKAYEELKEYEKSEKVLEGILQKTKDEYIEPNVLLDLARIQGLLGNYEKARKTYDSISRDYAGTEYADIAKSHKDFLEL